MIESVSGQLVASYTYDAYGNMSAQPISDDNLSVIGSALMMILLPQSYRGYTFSFIGEELSYYLGSRFYSPCLGRFLNADDPAYLGIGDSLVNCNIFAYCNNNPVMNVDYSGHASYNIKSHISRSWIIKLASKFVSNINRKYERTLVNYSGLGINFKMVLTLATEYKLLNNLSYSNRQLTTKFMGVDISCGGGMVGYGTSYQNGAHSISAQIAIGKKALSYAVSMTTNITNNNRRRVLYYAQLSCVLTIKHTTTLTATALVAASYIVIPQIAPVVSYLYSKLIQATVSSSGVYVFTNLVFNRLAKV